MRGRLTFLGSRLGRRLFGVFLVAAILPTLLLSVYYHGKTRGDVETLAREQLEQEVELVASALLQRLELAERRIALTLRAAEEPPESCPDALGRVEAFVSLCEPRVPIRDGMLTSTRASLSRTLSAQGRTRLAQGRTALATRAVSGSRSVPVFVVPDPRAEDEALLVELSPRALESQLSNVLPEDTRAAVVDGAGRVVAGRLPAGLDEPRLATLFEDASLATRIIEEDEELSVVRRLYISVSHGAEDWMLVLSVDAAPFFLPASGFSTFVAQIAAASLLLVTFASLVLIRRIVAPLKALREGVAQISAGESAPQVDAELDDELGDLARGFNMMSDRIAEQIRQLEARSDLDRTILTTIDNETIVEVFARHLKAIAGIEEFVIVLVPGVEGRRMRVFASTSRRQGWSDLPPAVGVDHLLAGKQRKLEELFEGADVPLLRVPVTHRDEYHALIAMKASESPGALEKRLRVVELANHLSPALQNARLVEEREESLRQVLEGLARVIDARSPWTAGHSQRVTRLAVATGRVMGLSETEIRTLHIAGLLHDIGKIGVSSSVLDKAGKLEERELAEMRAHTSVGARILEPIRLFRDAVPIVRLHHERFDGTGYPEGLAGEDIPLLARVVTVADYYDALVSDRVYREAYSHDDAMEILRGESGKALDPTVLVAFEQAVHDVPWSPGQRDASSAGAAPAVMEASR